MKQLIGILVMAALVVGVVQYVQDTDSGQIAHVADSTELDMQKEIQEPYSVVMYKDPQCGCCEGYAQALREEGYEVDIRPTQDMQVVKSQHNIPLTEESCHTSVIGEYVVEGHVPLAALEKLLGDQPDIAGIGLPGMPGLKLQQYEIYQLSHTGLVSSYLTI